MNITDIAYPREKIENWSQLADQLLNLQISLHNEYKQIEETNKLGYGILGGKPFDINTPNSQYYIKDMFWRVTEEMCEAKEVYVETGDKGIHFFEELIDALHFMIEIYVIINKLPPKRPPDCFDNGTIYYLGLAANCLKLKPWKQTYVETDECRFVDLLDMALYSLIKTIRKNNLNCQDIYDLFYKKHHINRFRIESKY